MVKATIRTEVKIFGRVVMGRLRSVNRDAIIMHVTTRKSTTIFFRMACEILVQAEGEEQVEPEGEKQAPKKHADR